MTAQAHERLAPNMIEGSRPMPDFRISATAAEHRKFRAAGPPAVGLWAMAGAYCMRELTDGWVPTYWITTWPAGKRLARKLVAVGLWTEQGRDEIPGFRFHDWADVQRMAEQIHDERTKARERMATVRKRQSATVVTREVRPNVPGERSAEHDDQNERLPVSRNEPTRKSVRPGPDTPQPVDNPPTREDTSMFAGTNGEPSANVHDALVLALNSGPVRGGSYLPAREGKAPPPRCPKHINDPGDRPCRACGDARQALERWEVDRRQFVRACPLCDAEGWRWEPGRRIPMTPYVRCDHQPLEHQEPT